MDLKKAKKILSALICLMILLLILFVLFRTKALIYLCIAIAVVYTVLYMKLWRCPHCGAVFGRSGGTLCPSCENDVGLKLRIP